MPNTLPTLLDDAMARFPDRPAVGGADANLTYRELGARVDAVAGHLAALGLEGRRVGLLLPNLPVFAEAFYGALKIGASVVLLNPLYSPREVAEYLADAGADTVLTTAKLAALLPPETRRVLLDDVPGALCVQDAGHDLVLPRESAPVAPAVKIAPDADAVIVYTAANGGWARGARLTHANLVANLRSTHTAMAITPEDRILAVLPWIHLFGLTVTLNAPLAAGALTLPVERFQPLRLLARLAESGATVISGVPGIYMALIAAATQRGVPEHRLPVAICGGAPLPERVARRWEQLFGVELRQGYGLTEAGPVCLFNAVGRPNRIGTLGYPFPGVEVTLRDEQGREVRPGEVGEICVAGANVFPGYLGDDGRRPEDLFGERLRTGDLGSAEPDGAIRFHGLLKPMFTRNGFNVYPHEVERVLLEDERIAAATVCSRPEAARENEVVAVVRAVPGAELTADAVRELCAARLAAFKQPSRIEIEPADASV
jgi:long-chain acyl-CoA synthetase